MLFGKGRSKLQHHHIGNKSKKGTLFYLKNHLDYKRLVIIG